MHFFGKKLISTTTLLATLSLGLSLGPQTAFAGNGKFSRDHASFTDYAKVISVEPVYRRVAVNKPVRECWIEQREHTTVYNDGNRRNNSHQAHSSGQAVIGGLIGGAIGNQIGRHTGSRQGRVGATVAGAILGSVIANESPRRHRHRHNNHGNRHGSHTVTESRPVEQCTTRIEKQYRRDFKGYDVTYRYRGHNHTTRLQYDPGTRIPVNVSISPANRNG